MKLDRTLLAAATLGLALSAAGARAQHQHDHAQPAAKPASATHRTVGVVKNVDPAKGTALIDHEPIKSLNWPRMTMVFKVPDKALAGKLNAGGRAEFEFVQQGSDYVITGVK